MVKEVYFRRECSASPVSRPSADGAPDEMNPVAHPLLRTYSCIRERVTRFWKSYLPESISPLANQRCSTRITSTGGSITIKEDAIA